MCSNSSLSFCDFFYHVSKKFFSFLLVKVIHTYCKNFRKCKKIMRMKIQPIISFPPTLRPLSLTLWDISFLFLKQDHIYGSVCRHVCTQSEECQ